MQPDLNDALLAVGALAVLAALLMGGLRLFGHRSPSTVVTTSLVLLGVCGGALVIWVLSRTQLIAEVSPQAAAQVTTTGQSALPATTTQPDPLLTATSLFLACAVPVEPGAVPDGATATLQEMQAARASVFAFDAATAAYNKCVDSTVNDGLQHYAGVSAPAATVQVLKALGDRLHNAALDKDQALANRMNQQIRIFKARHGS